MKKVQNRVMKNWNNKQTPLIALPVLVAIVFGVYLINEYRFGGGEEVSTTEESLQGSDIVDPFENIDLEAKAAIVVDIKTGEILFEKNSETQLPLASLTKLMTALVANETPNNQIVINTDSIEQEGDSGFFDGETWNKSDLLSLVLVSSSNDGASAIATSRGRESFVREMNKRANKLGLSQTYFLNESGLDVNSELVEGSLGSAKDMSTLIAHALVEIPEILEDTGYANSYFYSTDGTKHSVKNTNDMVDNIPFLVASKTGFTDLAGGNLSIIFDAGPSRPVAVVVLGSGLEGRFLDIERLTQATFEYLSVL